jgi:hypothetical protein
MYGERRGVYLMERVDMGDIGVDVRIILTWIFRKWDGVGGMDWFDLAQDRNR